LIAIPRFRDSYFFELSHPHNITKMSSSIWCPRENYDDLCFITRAVQLLQTMRGNRECQTATSDYVTVIATIYAPAGLDAHVAPVRNELREFIEDKMGAQHARNMTQMDWDLLEMVARNQHPIMRDFFAAIPRLLLCAHIRGGIPDAKLTACIVHLREFTFRAMPRSIEKESRSTNMLRNARFGDVQMLFSRKTNVDRYAQLCAYLALETGISHEFAESCEPLHAFYYASRVFSASLALRRMRISREFFHVTDSRQKNESDQQSIPTPNAEVARIL